MMNNNYNNGGNRQISLIPYVSINPGISLSENSSRLLKTKLSDLTLERHHHKKLTIRKWWQSMFVKNIKPVRNLSIIKPKIRLKEVFCGDVELPGKDIE